MLQGSGSANGISRVCAMAGALLMRCVVVVVPASCPGNGR